MKEPKKNGVFVNNYKTKIAPNLEKVEMWAKLGRTNKEIQENLEISKSTFYNYLSYFPEFKKAVEHNKMVIDKFVYNNWLNRIDEGSDKLIQFYLSTVTGVTSPAEKAKLELMKEEIEIKKRELELKEQNMNKSNNELKINITGVDIE